MNKEEIKIRVEQLLRELESVHPVKGFESGHVRVGYFWSFFGNTWLKNGVIMFPDWALASEALAEYVLIHEYCHLLREFNHQRNEWSLLNPWWDHDKKFKRIEDELLAEYGFSHRRYGGRYAKKIWKKQAIGPDEWLSVRVDKRRGQSPLLLGIAYSLYLPFVLLFLFRLGWLPELLMIASVWYLGGLFVVFEYGATVYSFFRAREIVVKAGRRWVW